MTTTPEVLDSEGLIDRGTYRVAPVRKGKGRTILEPMGEYYKLPNVYHHAYNERRLMPDGHFTIPVEMLERLPKMRKIIVDHLTACGIYLQGYNEPQG